MRLPLNINEYKYYKSQGYRKKFKILKIRIMKVYK